MNKYLLLIAASAAAYAVLRPKTTTLLADAGSVATGAASYVPSTPTPTPTSSGWATAANNVLGVATTATSLITAGTSVWSDLKDALHVGGATTAPVTAPSMADQSARLWGGSQGYDAS